MKIKVREKSYNPIELVISIDSWDEEKPLRQWANSETVGGQVEFLMAVREAIEKYRNEE